MPLFNFRRSSSSNKAAGPAMPAESVEVVRKRAKHRLIGASVLVLVGVVGFPLLFDTQPRPVAVDIPIEIPAKNAVKPLVMPAAPAAASGKVAAPASLTPREEIVAERKPAPVEPAPEAKKELKPEPKPETKVEVKPEPKVAAKPAPAADEASRAKALLEGKTPAADAEGRMVVQVGAFADADKAKEVRQKLEKAGLKTYTQVAETKDGKRIRVRVGPFASKAEADKAASKIKGLDLPAAILIL
jgi:DedD protein